MFTKRITYCAQPAVISCDALCSKAWGVHSRPRNPNDTFKTDAELGTAPVDPQTYEGDHAKPVGAKTAQEMNKWCARECERCTLSRPNEAIKLKTF